MSTKFGIREVCHCKFEPADQTKPTFYIDTAKMSTLEGASTSVYAQGGQGNSRLMAWEGEKTLTFTIEDALITKESFQALTGADLNGSKFSIYPHSFAGYYKITAYTLFREEDGVDRLATIEIPKAKLQTQLNLSMAPSGDPSTFTFTFDAFPDSTKNNLMFSLEISEGESFDGQLSDKVKDNTTTVYINGTKYTTTSIEPTLAVSSTGAITLTGATITETFETGDTVLTNFSIDLNKSESKILSQGSTYKFYIV